MSLYFEVKFCLVVTFCCNKTMHIHVIHCNIMGDELLLNFGAKFHTRNYKIAMGTFRMSQCQDGDEVLKFCE